METDWESKYQTNETPWDKGEPSPGLVDFLVSRKWERTGTVLVPGCGMGHDVKAWAMAGFRALGMDLAPSAVTQASKNIAGLDARIAVGNFLEGTPQEPFDWLFEHTLYCAINPARRQQYYEAALRHLKPGGHFLAIQFLIPDTEGPPFGTTREEVVTRFSPGFELLEEWVPRSYPNRTGQELMLLWRKR